MITGLFLAAGLFLLCPFAFGQTGTGAAERAIKGVVIDDTGYPIPGASVMIVKTMRLTIADNEGRFSMNVPSNATLRFSCIGYISQEIAITNQTELRVTLLTDVQMLTETVVVGYGTQKKANLTGAVSTIDAQVIESRPVANISQALQGTVANLNIAPNAGNTTGDWESAGGAPGAAQTINIRGYTGFSEDGSARSESPLVVIDGIQGGDINTLNMNDVLSVTVLKDAASAAIYGSSAPFGVIIITTKRGGRGMKPVITYNNNFMLSQPISLPQMQNSLDYAMAFNEFSSNSNSALLYNAGSVKRILEYMDGTRTTETIADTATDAWYSTFTSNANNDWFSILFKDASFSQQHNLGVSGGTASTTYYIGMGYLNQEGMYRYGNDYYKRYNARITLQTEISKWMTVGFRGSFMRGERDTPNYATFSNANILHIIAQRRPSQALYNPDGNFSTGSLVLQFRDGGRINNATDQGTIVGEMILHPMEGWDITANYAYTGTYENRMTQLKTVYHTLPSGKINALAGTSPNELARRMDRNERHVVNAFTSYEKMINKHYFRGMVGFMQELYDGLYLRGSNTNLYSDNILSLSTTYGTSVSATDYQEQLASRAVFGRINYNYKEKYIVEFNGRYDGTSRFMKEVRFKFYPGVSVGWTPSKESFWRPLLPVVNMFKIRASYGSQGSQGSAGYYPFYPALRTFAPTSSSNNWLFSGGTQPYVQYPASLVDPNLTWITTSTINGGVDMALLDNKLNISFDRYRRSSVDYQGPAEALPALLGTSAPLTNNAAMETNGFELSINWRHQIGKVNYSVDAVLSDYLSKVTKYPNPTKIFIRNGLNSTLWQPMWYEGRIFGEIWGFQTVGLFQSQEEIDKAADQSLLNAKPWSLGDVHYADLDGDGKITWGNNTVDNPGDAKIIGNTTPRYSFGVTLSADWNNFDIRVFVQGVGKRDSPANHNTGEYRFANFVWGIPRQGSYAQATMWRDQYDRWSEYNTPEENAKAFFPKMYMSDDNMKNTYEQTRYLQNAAYVRLKNIMIGYSLPDKLTKRIGLQKLRIYANVENIATWTKMISTLDPEFSTSDGKLYPLQRVWAMGLNVTF